MQLTKLAGALLAVALLTGSAAAMPGAAPAQAADNAETNETGASAIQEADGDRGPPVNLPEQVPGFVSDIHQLVGDHLAGDLTGDLGDRISGVTPDGGDSESSENSTERTETATPESDA